ncbi:MAG: zinc ribbon domain-containing protein [Verrucomicrobiae bacterium]
MSAKGCPHCGVANDFTRVFCADCGTRLPDAAPSAEAPALAAQGRPAPQAAPPISKPVRRTPRKPAPKPAESGFFGVLLRELILTAFLGAILAGLIQMAREPDRIPPRASANATAAKEAMVTLRELCASAKPASWTINQNAVNEFLATTIQMEASGGAGSRGAQFQRAFIRFDAGRLDLGVEQQVLGRSLYFLLSVMPEPSGQGLGAKVVGGAIGRLPMPPLLLPVFMRIFQPTITGLAQPLGLLRQAKSVTIKPEDVTLQWAGPDPR